MSKTNIKVKCFTVFVICTFVLDIYNCFLSVNSSSKGFMDLMGNFAKYFFQNINIVAYIIYAVAIFFLIKKCYWAWLIAAWPALDASFSIIKYSSRGYEALWFYLYAAGIIALLFLAYHIANTILDYKKIEKYDTILSLVFSLIVIGKLLNLNIYLLSLPDNTEINTFANVILAIAYAIGVYAWHQKENPNFPLNS